MTASEVAHHLDARSTGSGKWQARCPAHDDRSPSLSIAEGREGHVLVHCWAGCSTADVLSAAGLKWADICGKPTMHAERARLRRERAERLEVDAVVRRRQADIRDTHRAMAQRADKIAPRLAALCDGAAPAYPGEVDALAADYHAALEAAQELEAAHG